MRVVRRYYRPGPCANPQSGTRGLAKPPALCHTINMKNGNEVKVYSVMGGWDYEGFDGESLRLFDFKSAAEAYAEELKEENYDYVTVKVMDVCMQSAILP